MQRLLNNLLAAAVIGLILTSTSLVMAKGGGGHGGGHSGHSGSHKGSGHKSSGHGSHNRSHHGTHTSFSHHSHSRSFGHYGNHNSLSVVRTGGYRGHGYWPIYVGGPHPRWYCHDRYPVRFWFGGNYGVAGTDVVSTSVAVGGIDVEFTKIAQLDAGDATQNLAPAYRVWFHNNSSVDINQPFDVALLASTDGKLSEGLPYASVRINSLAANETTSVDIRLPIAAMTIGSSGGQPAPYAYVHTIIDSQMELVETNKANNLSVDSRDDIPAVTD